MDRRTGNLTNQDGKPLSIKERIALQEKSSGSTSQLSSSNDKKPIEIPRRDGAQAQPMVSDVNKKDAHNTSGGGLANRALPTQSGSVPHSNNPTPPHGPSPTSSPPPRPSTSPNSLSSSRDSKQLERERELAREEAQTSNLMRGSSAKLQKKEKSVALPKYAESVTALPRKPASNSTTTSATNSSSANVVQPLAKPLPHAKPTAVDDGPPTDMPALPPPIDLPPPSDMPSLPPPSDLPPSDLPPDYNPPSFDDGPPNYVPSYPPQDFSTSDYPDYPPPTNDSSTDLNSDFKKFQRLMLDRDERSKQISDDTPDEVLLKGQFEEISLQPIPKATIKIEKLEKKFRTNVCSTPKELMNVSDGHLLHFKNHFTRDFEFLTYPYEKYRYNSNLAGSQKPAASRLSYNIDQATHLESARDASKIDSALLASPNAAEGPTENVTRRLTDDYAKISRVNFFSVLSMDTPEDPLLPFQPPVMSEKRVHEQLLFHWESLNFQIGNHEPFFMTAALYDIAKREKLTENFDFQLNDSKVLTLLNLMRTNVGKIDAGTGATKCLFTIEKPNPNIRLVILYSRVVSDDTEKEISKFYIGHTKLKEKSKSKFIEEKREKIPIIGLHTSIFAVSSTPICDETGRLIFTGDKVIDDIRFMDNAKRESIIQLLVSDEMKKAKVIPARLTVKVYSKSDAAYSNIEASLNSSLIPVAEGTKRVIQYSEPVNPSLVKEVGHFPLGVNPYINYVSNFYFYPETVNFKNYKGSHSANNIEIEVKILEKDDNPNQEGLPFLYGACTEPSFVSSRRTRLTYHDSKPQFFDELKLAIPLQENLEQTKLHLVVSFFQEKCDGKAKKTKDAKDDLLLARCFIPLFPEGQLIDDGRYNVPLYLDLNPNYFPKDRPNPNPTSPKGEYQSPRPVGTYMEGNGKEVFTYRVKSISSVYTKDKVLKNVFIAYTRNDGIDIEQSLQQFHLVNHNELISHFIPVLDMLFSIISRYAKNLVVIKPAMKAIVTLFKVVFYGTYTKGFLESYIHYQLKNPDEIYLLGPTLLHAWCLCLSDKQDQTFATLSYQFSYLLFAVIHKSLALDFASKNQLPDARNLKMDYEIHRNLKKLVLNMGSVIVTNLSTGTESELYKFLNQNLAFFLRDLLQIMNRGNLFSLVEYYYSLFNLPTGPNVRKFETHKLNSKTRNIKLEKLTFLRALCSSEDYNLLNNPQNIDISRIKVEDIFGVVNRHHFLANLIIREINSQFRNAELRAPAVAILKDIFWKNEFDDRLCHPQEKATIAQMYLSFVLLAVENFSFLEGECIVDKTELVDWLCCCLYILKNSQQNFISDWIKRDAEKQKLSFLHVLSACLDLFQYQGNDKTVLLYKRSLNHEPTRHFDFFSAQLSNNSKGDTRSLEQLAAEEESKNKSKKSRHPLFGGSKTGSTESGLGSNSNRGSGSGMMRPDTSGNSSTSSFTITSKPKRGLPQEPTQGSSNNLTGIPLQTPRREHPHMWKKHYFSTLTWCGYCGEFMWGVTSKQGYQCEECHYPSHDKCRDSVPKDCTKDIHSQELHAKKPKQQLNDIKQFLVSYSEVRANSNASHRQSMKGTEEDTFISNSKLRSNEASFIVLQQLVEFVRDNKPILLLPIKKTDITGFTDKTFRVLIKFLETNSSAEVLEEVFKFIRILFPTFNLPFFRYPNTFCGSLCFHLLNHCNSKLPRLRSLATGIIVVMFENNFLEMRNVSRLKLQMTNSISQMFGVNSEKTPTQADFKFLKESLTALSDHAKRHFTALNQYNTPYGTEVVELVQTLFNLIDDNIRIEEYTFFPSLKAGYYLKMSETYLKSPDLRITELEKLANLQEKEKCYECAAITKVYTAALTAEYLGLLGNGYDWKPPVPFYKSVFPDMQQMLTLPRPEELHDLRDEICQSQTFTQEGFLGYIDSALKLLQVAELYESAVELCNIKVHVFRHQRNYAQQSLCYGFMQGLCDTIQKESGRIFALYYRVYFHAKSIPEIHKKEFIYKENGATRINDFKEKLKGYLAAKVGADNVILLLNSKKIVESEMEDSKIYLQVIDVKPHFEKDDSRPTSYEQNFTVNQFIYESPFTMDPNVPYVEDVRLQWKRKTILTTASVMPHLLNRIEVKSKNEIELTPFEVSLEMILVKIQLLRNELAYEIDKKTLAIQLHGTLLTQVNAGPISIAQIFLSKENPVKDVTEEQKSRMKEVFKSYVMLLAEALIRQKPLINTNEVPIQIALEQSYFKFKRNVCSLIDVPVSSITERFREPNEEEFNQSLNNNIPTSYNTTPTK